MSFISLNRDRNGRFVSPETKLKVWIDHTHSEEFIGIMTIRQFKLLTKDGGHFITQII